MTKKSAPCRPLFVSRSLLNPDDVLEWAQSEGFQRPIRASALHVTVALSREPLPWREIPACDGHLSVPRGRRRLVRQFSGVAVLIFGCRKLRQRHAQFRRHGAKWEHPTYQPHVAFAIDDGDRDLSLVRPYAGPLLFGPEAFKEPFESYCRPLSAADFHS